MSLISRLPLWQRFTHRYLRLIERLTGSRENEPLPIALGRRRIYVLPTGFGVALGTLVFVMLMGSLNFNNNMGLAFTFVLGALGLVAPLLTFLNLHRIELQDVAGERVFVGDVCPTRFLFRGAKAAGHWSMMLKHEESSSEFSIADAAPRVCELVVPTEKRGWMRLRRVTLETRYPVGLFRAWAVLSPAKSILVYPKPEADPPALPDGMGDRHRTRRTGGTDNFAGVREYQPQDPPRLVAWKAVARTGKMHSKQFSESGAGRVDLRESDLLQLDVEARVSRLTAWVLQAHERQRSWSLQLGVSRFPPATGDKHLAQCLEALALHEG